MSVLLAIETSQHRGSVAVRLPDGRIDHELLSQKKRHDDDLLPAIDRLFARNGLSPRDLAAGAVAVSIGPGGFTGLRIAVATAKMFAEALGSKIVAVPSALVAAEALRVSELTSKEKESACLVALAAKNNTFWLTRVQQSDGHWQIDAKQPPGIADASIMNLEGVAVVLADEHFPADARARCEREGVRIIPPVFEAANCLAVAQRMAARSEFTDPLELLPLYPRQPEAVTIWQQRAAAQSPKSKEAKSK